MNLTRLHWHVNAPRALVYAALLDANAVEKWMVPTGMTSHVHEFDAKEGGYFRISLTYDTPTETGKTTANTDTHHGKFVKFETSNPGMQGEMTITYSLFDADGGTDIFAVHDNLPPAILPADNEAGWRSSLGKLAQLVERQM